MNDTDWKDLLKACALNIAVIAMFIGIFFAGAYWHGWRPLG